MGEKSADLRDPGKLIQPPQEGPQAGLLWHPWKGVRTGASARAGVNTGKEPGLLDRFPGLALTSAGEVGRRQGPRPGGGGERPGRCVRLCPKRGGAAVRAAPSGRGRGQRQPRARGLRVDAVPSCRSSLQRGALSTSAERGAGGRAASERRAFRRIKQRLITTPQSELMRVSHREQRR